MMTISVQESVSALAAQLKTATGRAQMPFTVAKALNATGFQIRDEVRKNMPGRFTLRRQWIVQGIRVEKATKTNQSVIVYSRDDFMDRQEFGGRKDPLGNYIAIPTKLVRRTPKQLIAKKDRPKALGDKAGIVEVNGKKYLALKRGRKSKRNGVQLRLLYRLIERAQIKPRLKLRDDAEVVIKAQFQNNLEQAFVAAMKGARFIG